MSEPERYFFVHLQKTAGTSLYRRLRNHFGVDAVYPTPEHQFQADAVLDVDHLRSAFDAGRDRIRVVTGHFPYCTAEVLGVPFRTFTVLRHPLERTLSQLRHRRRKDEGCADLSLEEIYAQGAFLHGLVHNHMVKMLGLTPDRMTRGALTMVQFDEGWLERAVGNLERIDVVGLQEDFEAFCDELATRFGWQLGEVERANRTDPEPVSEEFAARILRDNDLDLRLYERAVELVGERRAGPGGGAAEPLAVPR